MAMLPDAIRKYILSGVRLIEVHPVPNHYRDFLVFLIKMTEDGQIIQVFVKSTRTLFVLLKFLSSMYIFE